jgi:hypothetical protein
MRPDYFVPDTSLFRAADAIASLAPCPFAGRVTRDQVLTALGEFGDIWPESIRADVIHAQHEQAEKIAGLSLSSSTAQDVSSEREPKTATTSPLA